MYFDLNTSRKDEKNEGKIGGDETFLIFPSQNKYEEEN